MTVEDILDGIVDILNMSEMNINLNQNVILCSNGEKNFRIIVNEYRKKEIFND